MPRNGSSYPTSAHEVEHPMLLIAQHDKRHSLAALGLDPARILWYKTTVRLKDLRESLELLRGIAR